MTLLKVKPEYQQILLDMEDEKIVGQAVTNALDSVKGKFEVKADNIACIIKNLDAEETLLAKEVDKLFKRANKKQSQSLALKEYLRQIMLNKNLTKLETPRNNIRLKDVPELVIDEKKFIDWAQRYAEHLVFYIRPFVKTEAVKAEIKAGRKMQYAELQETEKVVIE